MPRVLCQEETKELVPSEKGDCCFLLNSEVGPDTHVWEEKQCGEQAQTQQLWGAWPRLLLSCLHVEKDTLLGKRAQQTPRAENYPAGCR